MVFIVSRCPLAVVSILLSISVSIISMVSFFYLSACDVKELINVLHNKMIIELLPL